VGICSDSRKRKYLTIGIGAKVIRIVPEQLP
jgi:hypothetical protein